jgi:hypothetical protein
MKHTLDRRVATRWNSDYACLKAHKYFCQPVEQLIGLSRLKLGSYRLTEAQWDIVDDLVEALAVRYFFYCQRFIKSPFNRYLTSQAVYSLLHQYL